MSGESIADHLFAITGREWAVVELADVEDAIRAVAEWQAPAAEAQVRWTPGLAFHVAEVASRRETFTTKRGHFRPLADNMVAVYKRDFLTPWGKLDSARRQGGWGESARMSRRNGRREACGPFKEFSTHLCGQLDERRRPEFTRPLVVR